MKYPETSHPHPDRLLNSVRSLVETVQLLLGRRGTKRNRVVTHDDLIRYGLIDETKLSKVPDKL